MRSALAAPAAALALVACGPEAPPPPSLLLVSLDTVRADHTSLYGYERDTTPALASLAAESLVFEEAHTTAPWTLIAHMSLFTGLWPGQHGVVTHDRGLGAAPTLAERLQAEGYRTVAL